MPFNAGEAESRFVKAPSASHGRRRLAWVKWDIIEASASLPVMRAASPAITAAAWPETGFTCGPSSAPSPAAGASVELDILLDAELSPDGGSVAFAHGTGDCQGWFGEDRAERHLRKRQTPLA